MRINITTVLLFLGMFAFSLSSSAKIWRLNNNTGVDADVKASFAAAIDSASSGDTIYVEPSAVSYGSGTISKQLYIFGLGYMLAQNDSTQANPSPALLASVSFNTGSSGSLLTGVIVETIVNIAESNITIKRCRVKYQGINIYNSASNVFVIQNYSYASYGNSAYCAVRVQSGSSSVFIHNNYLSRNSLNYEALSVEGTSSADISNNVIQGNCDLSSSPGSSFTNNIWVTGDTIIQGVSSVTNNIAHKDQFPAGTNLNSTNMSTVFDTLITSVSATNDSRWLLHNTSPALGYGVSGVDCGMFGGLDPYILSGLPEIPAIFYFYSPSSGTTSTGLDVQIKVKSH